MRPSTTPLVLLMLASAASQSAEPLLAPAREQSAPDGLPELGDVGGLVERLHGIDAPPGLDPRSRMRGVVELDRFTLVKVEADVLLWLYEPGAAGSREAAAEWAVLGAALRDFALVVAKADGSRQPEVVRRLGLRGGGPAVLFLRHGGAERSEYGGEPQTAAAIERWLRDSGRLVLRPARRLAQDRRRR